MRDAAREVLNIKSEKELEKWTYQSVRVIASNLLHRPRFLNSSIPNRLRWIGYTFFDYLQNTIYNACEYTTELDISDNNLPPLEEKYYKGATPKEIFWSVAL